MSRTAARFTQADVARSIRAGQTFVYFLRSGEFVKIGQSRRWRERMSHMQTGSPHTIIPLLVLIDDPKAEKRFHQRFRADHFRGEWFHLGPAIANFIKASRPLCVAKSPDDDLRTPETRDDIIL